MGTPLCRARLRREFPYGFKASIKARPRMAWGPNMRLRTGCWPHHFLFSSHIQNTTSRCPFELTCWCIIYGTCSYLICAYPCMQCIYIHIYIYIYIHLFASWSRYGNSKNHQPIGICSKNPYLICCRMTVYIYIITYTCILYLYQQACIPAGIPCPRE
jgi:hypothetical protein